MDVRERAGASTAFCILYRILAMEDVPSFKINKMIYHKDSVYIRCIGLLFARYKFYNDEERLMKFFSEDVFKDTNDASFSPSVDATKLTSFSQFAIDLICSQEYFETLFPRIPEVLKRKMQAKIESALDIKKVEAKGCGGIGEWRRNKGDGKGRVKSVKESLSVNVGQRAPHMANVRERGRSGFDPESSSRTPRRNFRGGERERERERGRRRDDSRDRYGNRGRNDGHARGNNNGVRDYYDRERGDRRRRDASRDSYYYDYDDDSGYRDRDRGDERRRGGGGRELPYTRELPYKR